MLVLLLERATQTVTLYIRETFLNASHQRATDPITACDDHACTCMYNTTTALEAESTIDFNIKRHLSSYLFRSHGCILCRPSPPPSPAGRCHAKGRSAGQSGDIHNIQQRVDLSSTTCTNGSRCYTWQDIPKIEKQNSSATPIYLTKIGMHRRRCM
eukprot:GHVU01131355.1.p1 GENE.GHVU01131355.1~~GHVU01131355.1.p1  ORF type:complete len:156 (-),score=10.02 GHVU01131355.1:134-601(-)